MIRASSSHQRESSFSAGNIKNQQTAAGIFADSVMNLQEELSDECKLQTTYTSRQYKELIGTLEVLAGDRSQQHCIKS